MLDEQSASFPDAVQKFGGRRCFGGGPSKIDNDTEERRERDGLKEAF